MLWRISLFVGLLLGVLLLPWWLVLVASILVIWRLPFFYEAVVLGILFDLLYGVPTVGWLSLRFSATIVTLLLVCVLETAKEHVNLFPKVISR
jgi:hypothetical protein